VSQRTIGVEDVDLDFQGEYCKASIVIVGKADTIARDANVPYVKFIRTKLYPKDVDNVYLIGDVKNQEIIDQVCEEVSDIYDIVRHSISKTLLHLNGDQTKLVDNYFVFLSRTDSSILVLDRKNQ
jgi:hypothetical protein